MKRVSTKAAKSTLPGISFSSVKVSAIRCSDAMSGLSTATAIRLALVRFTEASATSYGRPVSFAHTLAQASGCPYTQSWARRSRSR